MHVYAGLLLAWWLQLSLISVIIMMVERSAHNARCFCADNPNRLVARRPWRQRSVNKWVKCDNTLSVKLRD